MSNTTQEKYGSSKIVSLSYNDAIERTQTVLQEHGWGVMSRIDVSTTMKEKMGFAFPFKDWLINDQYADSHTGAKNSAYHKKFINGQLHWSQFLTIFLIENYANA